MAYLRSVLAVSILVVFARSARAEGDADAAKLHFQVGQSYYDEANYLDALKEFREAYRLSKKPALLYNIALCHERLDQFDEAIAALEEYLRQEPNPQDRGIVDSRMANLKQRQAALAERSKPPVSAPAPSPPAIVPPAATVAIAAAPAPRRTRVWTWVAGGVGAALLIGALGAGVAAQLRYDSLSSKCVMNVCNYSGAQSDRDAGRSAAVATDVLWPLGLVAVGVATVLFFVEGRRARSAVRAAAFSLPVSGASF